MKHSVNKLKELQKEEYMLFSTYNRHHKPEVKIVHLQKLIDVITKIKNL